MSEDRPHRPALDSAAIGRELLNDVSLGRLDRAFVDAVLAALGLPDRAIPKAPSHGLSNRELEVARLLARGKTNRDIGTSLGISPGTVKIHVEHIYEKLGVHSRAGTAIWLMETTCYKLAAMT
jgi:DNA-binding NarL/FixJ family response regulator